MSKDPDDAGGAMASVGKAAIAMAPLVQAIVGKASPKELLDLVKLLKDTQTMEQRAELAADVIDRNHELASEAMRQRSALADQVEAVLARKDRDIGEIIALLKSTDDPAMAAALASALATVAGTDEISQIGKAMAQVKADRVDLKF